MLEADCHVNIPLHTSVNINLKSLLLWHNMPNYERQNVY